MLKSWRTLNVRDPQGELGSQGRLSTPAELMVWFTTPVLNVAEPLRIVRAVANRAFGGAEKRIKASLLRGGDHKVVQIELIRVGSCREVQRPHERFHSGQFIRRRQPEIRVRSTAVPSQRPREVLGDSSRRERLQVDEVAAKSKLTQIFGSGSGGVETCGTRSGSGKTRQCFPGSGHGPGEVRRVRARPHPLGIFQAEHSRTCNGAKASCRDAQDGSRTRVAVAHGAGQGGVHAAINKIRCWRNLRQHLGSGCGRSASARDDSLQRTKTWRAARNLLGELQRVEIEVKAGIEAGRRRLADEQRVERRGDGTESRLDIAGRQRQVQAGNVTSCAGPAIALESLAVEQILALGDLGRPAGW